MQVAGELHNAAFDACKAAEQSDAVARKLMQVDGMAAPGAGDVRLAGKLRLRRRQVTYFAVVLAHPGEPPVRILAAVAPRRPPSAAGREVDHSPGLIELLRDLCAGLRAADDEHGAGQKLLWIAICVGVKLVDLGWKLVSQLGNLRRLIEPRRHDDVARLDRLA